MLLPRAIAFLLTSMAFGPAIAQVATDAPVLLQGALPALRQVSGLGSVTQSGSALAASVEQSGAHRSGIPDQPNAWSYIIEGASTPPEAGLHLVLQVPASPTGEIAIMLNGSGPYTLVRGPGEVLTDSIVAPGSWLSVVFDGEAFQLMNGAWPQRRVCPQGSVAVNDAYCIDVNVHPSGSKTFFEAIENCATNSMRLCSWGEWITACERGAALGLMAIPTSYEWTNSAANENGRVRSVGGQPAGCASASAPSALSPRSFRCCYTR